MKSVERYVKLCNSLSFPGLEEKSCGNALFFFFDALKSRGNDQRYIVCKSIGRVIRGIIFERIEFKKYGNERIVFLFSNSYRDRKDYLNWFNNIIALINDKLVFLPSKNRFVFSLSKIKKVKYFFVWSKLLRKNGVDFKLALLISSVLFECYIDYHYIKEELKKKERGIFISVCDVHTIDYLVTQYCKSYNIKTATLQHGIFSKFYDSVMTLSASDYFLSYGDFSKEQCLASGMKKNKIINLGMPTCIGKNKTKNYKDNGIKKIAVFLGGREMVEDDIKLLLIALKFKRKYDYSIIVKMHPHMSLRDYKFDKWNYIEQIYGGETNISCVEIARNVRFSLTCGSTVLVEALMYLLPVFNLNLSINIYENVQWINFTNFEELVGLYYKYFIDCTENIEKKLLNLRDYFCVKTNVEDNYRLFLETFL